MYCTYTCVYSAAQHRGGNVVVVDALFHKCNNTCVYTSAVPLAVYCAHAVCVCVCVQMQVPSSVLAFRLLRWAARPVVPTEAILWDHAHQTNEQEPAKEERHHPLHPGHEHSLPGGLTKIFCERFPTRGAAFIGYVTCCNVHRANDDHLEQLWVCHWSRNRPRSAEDCLAG